MIPETSRGTVISRWVPAAPPRPSCHATIPRMVYIYIDIFVINQKNILLNSIYYYLFIYIYAAYLLENRN